MVRPHALITMVWVAGLGLLAAPPARAQHAPVAALIQARDRDLAAIRARATAAIAGLPPSQVTIARLNQRLAPIHQAIVAWGAKYSVPIRHRALPAVRLTKPNAATVIVKIPRSPNGPIVTCPPADVAGVACIITGVSASDTEIACTYDCPDPPEK